MKNQIETRLTGLELAILLTLLSESLAKTEYYERVNPVVNPGPNYVSHSERLQNLREKMSLWINPDGLTDFVRYNPHLSELFPSVLEDDIAKRIEDDKKAFEIVRDEE